MKPASRVYCMAIGLGLLAIITVSIPLTNACIGLTLLAFGMDML
jgi:hypothetical protein